MLPVSQGGSAGSNPVGATGPYLRLATTKTVATADVALAKLQRQVDEKGPPKTSITVGQAIEQWLDIAKSAPSDGNALTPNVAFFLSIEGNAHPKAGIEEKETKTRQ